MAGLRPADLLDFGQAQAKLEALARTVPLNAPWTAPKADVYDRQTMASWLQENTKTAGARALFELALVGAVGSTDVSLLYFLFYLHSAGGLHALHNTAAGA